MTIVKYRMLGTEYFKINRKLFDILHAFISKFRCSPLSSGMMTMHANRLDWHYNYSRFIIPE